VIAIHETAYPRLRNRLSEAELEKIFQPTPDEISFCRKKTKSPATRIGMLLLLKVFQRLGYFPQLSDVDAKIIDYVAGCAKVKLGGPDWLVQYESNDFRYRHIPVIRTYLGIKAFSENGRGCKNLKHPHRFRL
jgi:hypothetical protein